ncbi:MAG: 3-isopropylmalate dehydrogenase, partial [Brevundimonas sp.]
ALVVFPGGFGTFDELFEILTLRQTGKERAIPIVLVDEAYWKAVVGFDALVEHGMIKAGDLDLISFAEDAETAWAELLARGLNPGAENSIDPEQPALQSETVTG